MKTLWRTLGIGPKAIGHRTWGYQLRYWNLGGSRRGPEGIRVGPKGSWVEGLRVLVLRDQKQVLRVSGLGHRVVNLGDLAQLLSWKNHVPIIMRWLRHWQIMKKIWHKNSFKLNRHYLTIGNFNAYFCYSIATSRWKEFSALIVLVVLFVWRLFDYD